MPSTLPILRARRERRLEKQKKGSNRARGALISAGTLASLLLAALILFSVTSYANVTSGLPSIEALPVLLSPPGGMLLQPTRMYDRSGMHLIHTFAPDDSPRRYIPIDEQNPQHIPKDMLDAVIAVHDPQFWNHPGYTLAGIANPETHPTLAQQLVNDLLLFDEPASTRRAVRERLLAAQATARFGRTQILEWYLNSANFGNYAFGVESAARLYFGKPASELTLAESAMLAAVSEAPALNPLDAPQAAVQRGREVIYILNELGWANADESAAALAENPAILPAPPSPPEPAPAFVNMVLAQLKSQFPLERIERGGLNIISSMDYELQTQASCTAQIHAARLAGLPEPEFTECEAARWVPALPPGFLFVDSSVSALILDPKNGQVLAAVGETIQGVETPLMGSHQPGSSLDAFVYLTGFTRGLSPATLTWDIPNESNFQNFDGEFHGPMRLRVALANDYPAPARMLETQVGAQNVRNIAASFGVNMDGNLSLLQMAGAYGVFGTQGVYYGREIDGQFTPSTILKVENVEHAVLLDWSTPQSKSILPPAMAYVMTHVLSDSSARTDTNTRNAGLEIGKPAAVKIGQTFNGQDAWVTGYTPSYVVSVWAGAHANDSKTDPRVAAPLWNALLTYAARKEGNNGWAAPQGVSRITVCDPSGLLPTKECPNLVAEIFLSGSEPVQADDMFREFAVNRETGLLATVFTPPNLVDHRVYMIIPENARAWAASAGVEAPPSTYDAIQPPPVNPVVNITSPGLFAEVHDTVKIIGTASGEGFAYYRVQAGRGLNPQQWVQIGGDHTTPVESGVLAEWDTTGLTGLYAVQLIVIRADQRVETAVIQVTIANQP